MKIARFTSLAASTVVLLLTAVSANADPIIGTPVANTGSTETVGLVSSDGVVEFYIPLETGADAVYGDGNVNGDGTSSDTCSFPTNCGNGQVTMNLFFEGATAGANEVWILFEDFDAEGVNDPWFFVETLVVYDGDGAEIGAINSSADLNFSNNTFQAFGLQLDVEGDFYLSLVFSSEFAEGTSTGRYRNTSEYLFAFAQSVPEPSTLALLGAGLLGMGFAGRRRRDKALKAAQS